MTQKISILDLQQRVEVNQGKKGEAGFLAYYEIYDFLGEDNKTLVWDNEQMVPFAYKWNQWVGFDDERSFNTKVSWEERVG